MMTYYKKITLKVIYSIPFCYGLYDHKNQSGYTDIAHSGCFIWNMEGTMI